MPGQNFINRILSIILVVAIPGATGVLGYAIATPKVREGFTEFYVLGLGGKAVDYVTRLRVGEEGRVIVGIINHEQKRATYWVRGRRGGQRG